MTCCIWHQTKSNPFVSPTITVVIGHHFIDRIRERLKITGDNHDILNLLNTYHKEIVIHDSINRLYSHSIGVTIPYEIMNDKLFAISAWNTDTVGMTTYRHKKVNWEMKDYRE